MKRLIVLLLMIIPLYGSAQEVWTEGTEWVVTYADGDVHTFTLSGTATFDGTEYIKLLDNQQENGRNQEDAVRESPVVRIDVFVADCIDGSVRLRIRKPVQAHPLHLDGIDLMQHHELGTHQEILVVEETAHIGIDAEGCRFPGGQTVAEFWREINDPVHFPLPEEILRLFHVRASEGDVDLPCRIHLADHPPGIGAGRVIDHGNGCFLQNPVLVHEIVQDRV